MAVTAWAGRLGREVGLLDEDEWQEILPFLRGYHREIMHYRRLTGADLGEALRSPGVGMGALRKYQEMTGVSLSYRDEIHHIRMSHYGALCPSCGKPFRMPRASFCAECGFRLGQGRVAGPLCAA